MKRLRTIRYGRWLVMGLLCAVLAPCGAACAGTVKVATNLNSTHYYNDQNTFANVLLNFTGFPGPNVTADGVSRQSGQVARYEYRPKLRPGMWPESSDDPATWYKLTYHCDSDASQHSVTFPTGGFAVVRKPVEDGHGNWTGWLAFKESSMLGGQIEVQVNYAKDDLDEQGLARHPISRLKVLYPGCADDDFLSPVFKHRLAGFARLRFLDPANMNGRPVAYWLDVPGTKNAFDAERKRVLHATGTPQNVQAATRQGFIWVNIVGQRPRQGRSHGGLERQEVQLLGHRHRLPGARRDRV